EHERFPDAGNAACGDECSGGGVEAEARRCLHREHREAEAVPYLVEQRLHEVDLRARVAIEAEIERSAVEAAGIAEVDVELRLDVDVAETAAVVGDAGRQVDAGELVGERLRIPAVRDAVREVAPDVPRARAAEHGLRRRARKRLPAGADGDRHAARELRAPDGGDGLVDVESLLAERRSRIAADRGNGSRIVEADARRITAADDDRRGGHRDGGGTGKARRDDGGTKVLSGGHRVTPSAVRTSWLAPASRSASKDPGRKARRACRRRCARRPSSS